MKEEIRDTATRLFLELGFKSVTMDDLADAMGISKKTIYTHFDNKTELIEACTVGLFYKISQGIDLICERSNNPIEELYEIKRFVMLHLNNEKASPDFQLKKYYPQIYTKLHQLQYDLMKDCVLTNLNRGIEMGIFRPNLDAGFVSRIYFSGVTSIKDENLFPRTKFPAAKLMDSYLEYHLRGIVTPEGRKILNNIIESNKELQSNYE
ncbi:DNA-binding transcriptional regulator, AcrR family [Robiginitalea myxolifaciens]|uniref:DNA-binding transcriptional regulator, AcrR family n=1 Tax=Robiginitalea myxolifaciens TaxID=400055 RepID=A0A1I6FYS8_9FLAO|nr:TetR/AcrR family transcriptional regulator [Robiginitalea myxolifaciens]SFR35105.1 DNA-binding transcriptional regulator, AcrR family [Robiginitalea myxolifaciens]